MSKLTQIPWSLAYNTQEVLSADTVPPPGGGSAWAWLDSAGPHPSTPTGLRYQVRGGSASGDLSAGATEASIIADAIADAAGQPWGDWTSLYELTLDGDEGRIFNSSVRYSHSGDTGTASVSEVKWQLVSGPTASCYLKVWIQKEKLEIDGSSLYYTNISEITLTPSATLITLTHDAAHADNLVFSSATVETFPPANETQTLRISRISLLSTYTPVKDPFGKYVNGFPPWGDGASTLTKTNELLISDDWTNP